MPVPVATPAAGTDPTCNQCCCCGSCCVTAVAAVSSSLALLSLRLQLVNAVTTAAAGAACCTQLCYPLCCFPVADALVHEACSDQHVRVADAAPHVVHRAVGRDDCSLAAVGQWVAPLIPLLHCQWQAGIHQVTQHVQERHIQQRGVEQVVRDERCCCCVEVAEAVGFLLHAAGSMPGIAQLAATTHMGDAQHPAPVQQAHQAAVPLGVVLGA
ncbi:hypothetical protein COO60DRAFT_1511882 [Scenedesmus sp. NREL 46B-D3]|nr:hypothetical protein COO60DRAFT_1511882 [Scenedesmus sp. NREL 46B-D3]